MPRIDQNPPSDKNLGGSAAFGNAGNLGGLFSGIARGPIPQSGGRLGRSAALSTFKRDMSSR